MIRIATAVRHDMSRRAFRASCGVIVLLYLGLGLFYSRTLISWDDESSFLALGEMAITGQVALFQDEMTGQRMPLPFYVLGASQIVFGRNLWVARLVSLALGVGVLAVTVAVARLLGGDRAGVLAGLLVATQGAVVGYYATATYQSLTALILMAAVWVMLKDTLPWRAALGMAAASLLFLTRTNLFPALPFFFVWALWLSRSAGERAAVVVAAGILPAAFFLSDPTHLKLLAHVPLLRRFVAPLGYRSILEFSAVREADLDDQLWAVLLFARRYESWAVAGAGVAAGAALVARRHGIRPVLAWPRELWILTSLWVWLLLWHFVMWRVNFKIVAAYFPSFAPLLAVMLGVGFAALLRRDDLGRLGRGVALATLAVALTVSVGFVRHPLMPRPIPVPFFGDSIQQVDRAARDLGALVPAGSPVFLFAQPMPAYLARVRPYLQQIMSPGGTLAPESVDPTVARRNGVWGIADVDRWLGREAAFAIIAPHFLVALSDARPESVQRMRELLTERFERIGRIGGGVFPPSDVYRRIRS